MRDPLHELLRAIRGHRRPSLAWVLEWSQDGREPVAAAWAASRDCDAMLALLTRWRPDLATEVTARVERALGPGWYHRESAEIVPVVRGATAALPTLDELLTAPR